MFGDVIRNIRNIFKKKKKKNIYSLKQNICTQDTFTKPVMSTLFVILYMYLVYNIYIFKIISAVIPQNDQLMMFPYTANTQWKRKEVICIIQKSIISEHTSISGCNKLRQVRRLFISLIARLTWVLSPLIINKVSWSTGIINKLFVTSNFIIP